MVGKRGTLEERFWPKVARGAPDECWLWTAGHNGIGYGMIQVALARGHTKKLAHRVSYEMAFGPIPDGKVICHRCDTPRCVNPGHLFLGTMADNTRDMLAKGRDGYSLHPERFPGGTPPRFQGSEHPSAKLTEERAYTLRRRLRARTESLRAMARETGLDRKTLMALRDGKTWAHVPD